MPPKKKKAKTEEIVDRISRQVQDPDVPVVVVETSPDEDSPVLNINSESLFSNIIHPIPPFLFMDLCFRKKALHIISSSQEERIQPIVEAMNNLDPSYILQETSSDNVFVWILDKETGKIQSVEINNVETAIALHTKGGHATYCRAPPDVEQPMVANMLRGTGMGCGNYDPSGESSITMGQGEVEVFMGTSQHTTDWHYDFQENFTLQLSGVKRWTLQQGTVKHPLRGCTPHYNAPHVVESQLKVAHLSSPDFKFTSPQVGVNAVGKEMQRTVLPGDVLYFPAGMWHKVETIEPGISINVSLMATNYATLVSQALQHYLLKKDEWRQSVVGTYSEGDTALSHLQELFHQLPSVIENLVKINFAEQILPPVLRNPPRLELVGKDDEDTENDGADGSPTEISNVMTEHGQQTAKENEDMEIVDDDDEEEESDEEIVDIHEFDAPVPQRQLHSTSGKMTFNSLASLMKMSDIVSFYNDDKESDEASSLYVLNINYAGNEMHESVIRVVLKDTTGQLDNFVDGTSRDDITCPRGVQEAWQECLLYYGFLVWISNDVSTNTS